MVHQSEATGEPRAPEAIQNKQIQRPKILEKAEAKDRHTSSTNKLVMIRIPRGSKPEHRSDIQGAAQQKCEKTKQSPQQSTIHKSKQSNQTNQGVPLKAIQYSIEAKECAMKTNKTGRPKYRSEQTQKITATLQEWRNCKIDCI